MFTSVLAIWLLAQPNPPLNPNSVRDKQRSKFFDMVKYWREKGAVVFVGEFGAKTLDGYCPQFEVIPVEPLIGGLPSGSLHNGNCDKNRRPGKREVFLAAEGYAAAASSFVDQEKVLPSLDERRQMVVLAVRAQEALTNEEFLKLARQGLADGFPHVLKGLHQQARRRLRRAPEKDQDALAVLILDLYDAKILNDRGCATDLRRNFDVNHYYKQPRLPGIRPDTQRRAEEMYAALPEEARNPPPQKKPSLSSEKSRERARARARGEKILLGSPEHLKRIRRDNEKQQESPSEGRSR